MSKRVLNYFRENYFDTRYPLEYRLYMIFFFETYFISIFSATTNTLLGKGLFGVVLQWSYNLFCLFLMFSSIKLRMRFSKGILIFLSYLYVPFLFFQTAGYDGTALLFSTMGVFILAVAFKGRARIPIIAGNLLICICCCFAQYYFPELVIPHAGAQAKLIDLLVALILAVTGMSILTIHVSKAFAREEERIKTLLHDIEQSNIRLTEMSNRDALTGAYNRRYLVETLERTIESCNNSDIHFYFMMLDLDHFKQINDTYGHGFGDEVLISTVKAISDVLRKSDTLARFGGEEFSVILFNVEDAIALMVAERIRESISAIEFRNKVRISISIGLVKSRRGESVEDIYKRADNQLYRAKREGRNRVCSEDVAIEIS